MAAISAPVLAPHSPEAIHLSQRFAPPMWLEKGTVEFPLGTDHMGRDLLSRMLYGARISLIVGLCAVALSAAIGIAAGLLSGYYGGWIDTVIIRLVDGFLAIPTILTLLVVLAVARPGLLTLILVIGATNWIAYARVIRSEVLSVKERDYVKAALAAGASGLRILAVHILPNVMSSAIVVSSMSVATVILLESSLSFLGLGVQSPEVTWGIMLSDGRQFLATSWWIATFPGLAITVTVLSVIFVGDWLRDRLDPKLEA